MDILSFGMNGYNLVFLHNLFQRYGGDTYMYKEGYLRTAIEAVSFLSFKRNRSSLRREEKHCGD